MITLSLPPDEESLHLQLESDHGWLNCRIENRSCIIVSSDGATDGDPAVHVHVHHDRVGDVATNIVKIAVNSFGSNSPQCGLELIINFK